MLLTIKVCGLFQPGMAGLVRTVLKGRDFNESLCCIIDDTHTTLLHCAARNLCVFNSSAPVQAGVKLEELLSLINDLIKGGSKLQALTLRGRTPLLEVLDWLLGSTISSPFIVNALVSTLTSETAVPMRAWLKQLKDSGVDLVNYGKNEQLVLESPGVYREFWYYNAHIDRHIGQRRRNQSCKMRLINFTYGPEPDDWAFWFVPVMQDYFMDFWEMIDHPERAMPGAWEEEYPYDPCSYYDEYYYDSSAEEEDEDTDDDNGV